MVFAGAAMAFIGIGLYMFDIMWPGVILIMIGIASVVIGFTILKFHMRLAGFKKEDLKKK